MKKLFLCAAVLMGLVVHAKCAVYSGIPSGPAGALATPAYAGVDIATVTTSSSNVLLFNNGGSINYIMVSSAPLTGTPNIIIRTSVPVNGVNGSFLTPGSNSGAQGGTGDYSTNNIIYTIYPSTFSSGFWSGDLAHGFIWAPPAPIRIPKGGALIKFSDTGWGSAIIGNTDFNQ